MPPLKKNDKTASILKINMEEFQPITFESHTLSTIALLLRSQEEDIIIKSLGAIMKYIEKSDSNKIEAKERGIIKALMPHLKHPNKNIIKYTCMNCAILASLAEIRLEMKNLGFIQSLLEILKEDHENGTYEYATLALSYVAIDYSGRHLILKLDSLPIIIQMLSLNDPDVQKNSAEILLLLLKDIHAVRKFESTTGVNVLFELLKSEFEEIQKLAILCLARVSERGKSSKVFLFSGGLQTLLQFLEKKTIPDFQADILNILVNCLDDDECEQFLSDSSFIDIIMDMIKSGNQSDSRLFAVKALSKLVKNIRIMKLLKREEIDRILVECLSSDIIAIQASAAKAIALIVEHRNWRNTIQAAGGIEILVSLLSSSDRNLQLSAIHAVCNMIYSSSHNCRQVYELHGIDKLVEFLYVPDFELQAAATASLTNLAIDSVCREKAIQLNVMIGLMKCLESRDLEVQLNTCTAIAAYVCDQDARNQLLDNGLGPIVKLLSISKPEIYTRALWIISTIGIYPNIAVALCEQGIINFLCKHVKWGHRNNFADLIMTRILSTHLPAKYGYIGRLAPQDHIYDIFFDVGQWSWDRNFPKLEELINEPVDVGNTVFLINFQVKASVSNVDSTDELVETTSSTFQATRDSVLVGYLHTAKIKIQPIEDLREQISQLAEYISKLMGGKYKAEEVNKFSNDLEISQLKAKFTSNVIPIGSLKRGLFRPRALLFKAFSDHIGLPCSLVRGNFSRVWNEVWFTNHNSMEENGFANTETFIVDLVFEPGRLMPMESFEATQYCEI